MESLISDICQTVAGKLKEEGNLLVGVPKEADKMLKNLKHIKTVMASAEKKALTKEEDVEEWISELKEVAYDIEDVLEDWSDFQPQMQGGESSTSQRGNKPPKEEAQVCFSCIPTPSFCIKQVKDRHQIAHAIAEINERLDDIADRRKKFDFEKNYVSSKDIVEPESISTPFDDIFLDVPSQEEAKSTLIQKLVRDDFSSIDVSPNHIPIVSIVGMGGIGKTTLAQMVYNDQTVQNHFSSKMIFWVCVSDNSTQLKVAKAIAVALGLKVADLPDDPTIVLTKIVDYIKDRTFLLVLDDVWENSVKDWGAILTCLGKGDAKQSRILLTTRSSVLAEEVEAVSKLDVAALSKDDSWSLFSHYAFSRRAEEDRMRVEDIARVLVRKCKGLPLALQVLGKFMRTKKVTRQVWQDVLSSKIWETKFKEDVFPSLVLSYLDLPSQVKRCFTFCSIFPKDTVMWKNELIRLWMAQGYLQGNTTDNMEVYGEQYFEWLVARSFFRVKYAGQLGDTVVTMHDLVHDFAQHISDGETVIVDPSVEVHICKKARHLAFSGKIGESICSLYPNIDLKGLRTLLLSEHSTNILEELCLNKSYIRALKTQHISSSVDLRKLEHLRYMCLSLGGITFLPEGICDLRYLQTLDLEECRKLKSLPKDIERLTCLRHLLFSEFSDMANLPKGLGKLSSLRTLGYFPCSSVDSKDCCSLEDLRDLNNLRGQLFLRNLNKVEQAREATGAQLHMKKNIQQLILEFGEGNPIIQSDVLDALEPAKENNIELLQIREHKGQRCPGWITYLRYLKEIQLKGVDMDSLPELGTLLYLEKLCVCDAIEVKHVGVEFFGPCTREAKVFFPKLTSLEFINMPWWEHWESPKEILNTRIAIMPSLHCLTLRNCGLRSLPRFLEYAPLARLEAHCRLLPVTSTGDGYPRRWSIGNIVLPPCLKEINTSWVEFEKKAPANQLAEGSEEIDSRLYWHNYTVPEWITDHLKEITLSHATDECLPPFGKMASLEKLTIMFAVKVGNESLGISNNTNDEAIKGRAGGRELATCIFFPTLKKLHFAWMPGWKEWEDPAHNYSVPKWITDHVTYLRDITLSHATDECLPPFGIMACLEKLTIMFAVKVEKVGNEFLGISNSTNDEANKGRAEGGESATCILFPRLKKLHFAWMPLWKEWEGPAHQNNLIIMPSLCHLKINECKELNCLPQFLEVVDLKKLEVDAGPEGSMPKIQNSTTSYANNELSPRTDIREISLSHIRHGWVLDWSKYCVGLRELQLDNCDAASLAALEVFPSLEVLRICYCPEIRRLGKEVILISSLKELHLSYLRNLEEWEDPSPPQLETSSSSELTEISRHGNKNNSTVITCMPQFRILSILYCPKLKALPDFLRSIPLESLSIEDCWAIEAWCAIEAGEDWRNWTANIPQFNFTGGYLGNFPISTQNVEVPELNRDNYKVWKERILWKLSNRDLCFAIENPKLTITDDSTEEEIATHEQWVKANRMSCIYIKTKMSPSTRGSVDHHHDVNDLLKAIDEQFIDSDKALASKLIMEFLSMKLTTVKGVREHIMKMRDLAAKLKTLKEVDMSEAFLVHLTLNSLPEEYTSFKETYHTQRDKRSINELITMCVQEEERLLMDHVKECDDDYQG